MLNKYLFNGFMNKFGCIQVLGGPLMLHWGLELIPWTLISTLNQMVFVEPSYAFEVISMPSWRSELVISCARESTLNEEFGRGIAQGLIWMYFCVSTPAHSRKEQSALHSKWCLVRSFLLQVWPGSSVFLIMRGLQEGGVCGAVLIGVN